MENREERDKTGTLKSNERETTRGIRREGTNRDAEKQRKRENERGAIMSNARKEIVTFRQFLYGGSVNG